MSDKQEILIYGNPNLTIHFLGSEGPVTANLTAGTLKVLIKKNMIDAQTLTVNTSSNTATWHFSVKEKLTFKKVVKKVHTLINRFKK
jgi:hypothetical protein